ncbi:MAG: Hsp20/alpha crystallin family protein [Bdellovibrionales bacterium]|nr:Hsp20/alpha crystallin family protein [Bdellovibrionales bacterium]
MRNQLDFWRGDRNFNSFQRAMNRLIDDFWSPGDVSLNNEFMSSMPYGFAPTCAIEDCDENYVYCFDIPGVNRDDIKVEVSNGNLVISGERKEAQGDRSRIYERHYGRFQRSIHLPENVDPNQVEAAYENGVLRVAIPKSEETRTTNIPISEGKTGFFQRLGTKAKEKLASSKTTEFSQE